MTSTLIVVGSAPCLFDDVEKAQQMRPFAALMLVNGACTAIEHVEHVLAGHTDKAEMFAAGRRAKFPGTTWQLHASVDLRHIDEAKQLYPSVTDWHGKDICTGATSIAKAAKLGFKLGFDEIILAGAPMDGSGYSPSECVVKHNCKRVGDKASQTHRVIEGYRLKLKKLADGEFKHKVFSMSGYTRECLGAPPRVC